MPFSIVVASTGIVSFFGLFYISQSAEGGQQDRDEALRFAIAGAVVIEYLVLVGIVAFFKEGAEQLPVITQTLISNFTAIVGVVIAFYFGSSAYVQGKRSESKPGTRGEGEDNKPL